VAILVHPRQVFSENRSVLVWRRNAGSPRVLPSQLVEPAEIHLVKLVEVAAVFFPDYLESHFLVES